MLNYKGHGGKNIVERVVEKPQVYTKIQGLLPIPVRRQIAHEAISIGYGFFTPLQGFMNYENVDLVNKNMELSDGTLWSIPIIFDISSDKIKEYQLKEGDTVLLTYLNSPLAIFEIDDIFTYDKQFMAQKIYMTDNKRHPGVQRTYNYANTFLGGKITIVNEPKFTAPYSQFWVTPRQHFEIFQKKHWKHIVAHQTRNVPHTAHEWLMKYAWFAANEDLTVDTIQTGILVNTIIGEKRIGDYIDEAILLAHNMLRVAGYFREDVHMVSFTLWDMRYAGPREAVLHAILRTNLGCTHHMFGRDHAGVGDFYNPYDAHHMLKRVREKLDIKPVFMLENWYCPVCGEVTNAGLCNHRAERQNFSGTLIRSMLIDGVKPTKRVMRPEVFNVVMTTANQYGFGSPFVTEKYLSSRQPIFTLEKIEVTKA